MFVICYKMTKMVIYYFVCDVHFCVDHHTLLNVAFHIFFLYNKKS